MSIAIIGCSGRDNEFTDPSMFDRMVDRAWSIIEEFKLPAFRLVSGGAAWSDHVAVALCLKYKCLLDLHLPCQWTGSDFESNHCGRVANRLHRIFSSMTKRDSLAELEACRMPGNSFRHYKGFYARNTAIAKSDYMIAFSWSKDKEPVEGGTLNTWKQAKKHKFHISLHDLMK